MRLVSSFGFIKLKFERKTVFWLFKSVKTVYFSASLLDYGPQNYLFVVAGVDLVLYDLGGFGDTLEKVVFFFPFYLSQKLAVCSALVLSVLKYSNPNPSTPHTTPPPNNTHTHTLLVSLRV